MSELKASSGQVVPLPKVLLFSVALTEIIPALDSFYRLRQLHSFTQFRAGWCLSFLTNFYKCIGPSLNHQ